MKKFLLMITIFLCVTPTVFGAERYQYNTSWDDEYLGLENIQMILDYFGTTDSGYLTSLYDKFVYSFSKIKEIYPNVKLYDLYFYKYSYHTYDSSIAYTVSNGFSKNESLPYINLIPGTFSTNVNWTTDVNSTGTIAQSDYFNNSGGLSTARSSVNTSSFTVNEVENEDYVLLNGGMTTFASTYSILYDNQKAYISNSLPGLLISQNEYISTDVEPEPEPEIIPDTIDSTYGYLWSPSASDVEINLDYKEQNQLIHGEHFIGSALQSTFVFYYYSGDDIVSFNDYVTRNVYLNTDFGTWYDFYIEPENLEYLPSNTNFYLNIYATLNDNTATVVKDFLAFHTVDNSGGGDIESGDNNENIQESIQNGIVQGNTEYWGSSGDLNGEKQEELISGKVDELTEQISGDLAENEIFGILKTYEDKIFGSFIGEEDFKISWNDVSYMNSVIIPKGEVNFSEMCRENETLANIKTTINIILGFFLLSNCVIYLYNLLLATLGIDNPYLYETPPEEVNTVTYDTNINSGVTTEIKTSRKRDGTTFRTRRKF